MKEQERTEKDITEVEQDKSKEEVYNSTMQMIEQESTEVHTNINAENGIEDTDGHRINKEEEIANTESHKRKKTDTKKGTKDTEDYKMMRLSTEIKPEDLKDHRVDIESE